MPGPWGRPLRVASPSRGEAVNAAATSGAQPRVTLRKDCLGGEKIVDVDFGEPLAMAHLDEVSSAYSDVQRTILVDLPRPFFRVDVHGRFLLTGILGDASARFTVRRHLDEDASEVAIAAARTMMDGGRA